MMLDRAFCFSIFTATVTLVGCNLVSDHCIGDCGPLSATEAMATTASSASPATDSGTTYGSTTQGEATLGGTTTSEVTTSTNSHWTSTSSTTSPSPSLTCRDAIACYIQCKLLTPDPLPPDYDAESCYYTDCLDLLSQPEWLKLLQLQECVLTKCAETACMNGDSECEACFYLGLGDQTPDPGDPCEMQAKACT